MAVWCLYDSTINTGLGIIIITIICYYYCYCYYYKKYILWNEVPLPNYTCCVYVFTPC